MARSSTTAAPNNGLALKHGAKSIVVINSALPDAVEEVRAALASSLTYLEPPDAMLVEQLARLVVRIRLVDHYYDRLGGSMVDSRGRPRGSWQLYLALLREFRATCSALGIGPAARASLMGDFVSVKRESEALDAQRELERRYRSNGA